MQFYCTCYIIKKSRNAAADECQPKSDYARGNKLYYIIANGKRLKGENLKQLEIVKEVFEKAGKEYEVAFTYKRGDAKILAEKITKSGGSHTLAVMGGDGTLHDIINGFHDFENCYLGLIPSGTGNDFAEGAGIPFDTKKAAEIIAYRAPQPVDFIELSSGLRSINSVGMGIDVDVLKRAYAGKYKGRSKYLKALLTSIRKFKGCSFTVEYNGIKEKRFGLIAALGNGRQFGGGIKMFPDAKINDGYLDLIMVDYISKSKILGAFIKLMRGKVNSIKGATVVKTKSATFYHEDENYTIQAEGELYDNMPIVANIVEGKLKFYLP